MHEKLELSRPSEEINDEYTDLISFKSISEMKDPVMTPSTGHIYDREDILRWINARGIDPVDRDRRLAKEELIPCRFIKQIVKHTADELKRDHKDNTEELRREYERQKEEQRISHDKQREEQRVNYEKKTEEQKEEQRVEYERLRDQDKEILRKEREKERAEDRESARRELEQKIQMFTEASKQPIVPNNKDESSAMQQIAELRALISSVIIRNKSLEDENAQLNADKDQLTADKDQLTEDNAKLVEENQQLQENYVNPLWFTYGLAIDCKIKNGSTPERTAALKTYATKVRTSKTDEKLQEAVNDIDPLRAEGISKPRRWWFFADFGTSETLQVASKFKDDVNQHKGWVAPR